MPDVVPVVHGDGVRQVADQGEGPERVDHRREGPHLLDHRGEELALPLDAVEVTVGRGVAGTHVTQRSRAVHFLAAGLDIQARHRVVDGFLGAQGDATDGVHDPGEAGEPELHVVVDAHAGVLLDGLLQQLRAPVGEGGVDLVHAVAGDLHVGVARDGDHRRLAADRRDVDDDDGVRALPALGEVTGGVAFAVLVGQSLAGVRADEQPVRALRVPGGGVGERVDPVEAGIDPPRRTADDHDDHQQEDAEDASDAGAAALPLLTRCPGRGLARWLVLWLRALHRRHRLLPGIARRVLVAVGLLPLLLVPVAPVLRGSGLFARALRGGGVPVHPGAVVVRL